MKEKNKGYYLPSPSSWPLKGSIALICIVSGAANWMHESAFGPYLMAFGFLMLFYVIFGWFGTVIRENRKGLLENRQVDLSFRWGMCWFIFSEVMFFGAFFWCIVLHTCDCHSHAWQYRGLKPYCGLASISSHLAVAHKPKSQQLRGPSICNGYLGCTCD